MSECSRVVRFVETGCQIVASHGNVLVTASKCGSLFLLDCRTSEQMNVAKVLMDVWHRQYGHLNGQSLRQLSSEELVDGFGHNGSKQTSFVSLVQMVNITEVHFLLEVVLELSNHWISFTRMWEVECQVYRWS